MFVYTVLGDSITAGEAATSPTRAYPALLTGELQSTLKSRAVRNQILAHPGWTSGALMAAVLENPAGALCASEVISIWVGGDNLIQAGFAVLQGAPRTVVEQSILQYGRDLVCLITYIRMVSKARIIVCTQYNPFPNSPMAAEAIGALNEATITAASRAGALIARPDAWFAGREPELIAGYRSGRIEDALRGRPGSTRTTPGIVSLPQAFCHLHNDAARKTLA